jgi:hypothetical protein
MMRGGCSGTRPYKDRILPDTVWAVTEPLARAAGSYLHHPVTPFVSRCRSSRIVQLQTYQSIPTHNVMGLRGAFGERSSAIHQGGIPSGSVGSQLIHTMHEAPQCSPSPGGRSRTLSTRAHPHTDIHTHTPRAVCCMLYTSATARWVQCSAVQCR